MPLELHGEIFYRTLEACQMAGISRATLFRWFSKGIVANTVRRDRRGWRLFTEDEIATFRAEAHRIE